MVSLRIALVLSHTETQNWIFFAHIMEKKFHLSYKDAKMDEHEQYLMWRQIAFIREKKKYSFLY